MRVVVIISVTVFGVLAGVAVDSWMSGGRVAEIFRRDAKPLMWDDLEQLDIKTGITSDKLRSHNGEYVKIPGFAVPLGDDLDKIAEFLLVPDPMSCIHVPPPPPNQIVHVKLKHEIPAKTIYGPVWVEGFFNISETKSVYGSASFRLDGNEVYRYQ